VNNPLSAARVFSGGGADFSAIRFDVAQEWETAAAVGLLFTPSIAGKGGAFTQGAKLTGELAGRYGRRASQRGASLTISKPKILSTTNDARIHRDYGGKLRALQSAARRGELRYTPDTDSIRVSSLQSAYRARVIARYESRFGMKPNLSRLDADHPVDLVAGGRYNQQLKLRNESINRSFGSSIKAAARRQGLQPGDRISEILIRGN